MGEAPPKADRRVRGFALLRRRGLLGGLGALLSAAQARAAAPVEASVAVPPAEPFPDRVTIMVPGPPEGRMGRWAELIGAPLLQALPPATACRPQVVGGGDGVTAANQFQARGAPDGATVLLLPGAAPLAWLIGDPRARFEAASWIPVMTGLSGGVVASRVPAEALRAGTRLRVACSAPGGPELAALLGLDLMGVEIMPACGLDEPRAALRALRGGMVDAMLATGAEAPELLGEAHKAGAAPLFALGVPAEPGMRRDPAFAGVPTAEELAERLGTTLCGGPLHAAWRAAAVAAQVEFALVLPPLTPAALVAQWRRAGDAVSGAVQKRAEPVRMLSGPAANVVTASVAADVTALLELRRWLAARFNWTPS